MLNSCSALLIGYNNYLLSHHYKQFNYGYRFDAVVITGYVDCAQLRENDRVIEVD